MTLVNLTEKYLSICNPSLFERLSLRFDLDLYRASSLFAIEEHFKKNPPKKKDRFFSKPAAMISIDYLEIKRATDSFDENDGVPLRYGLNEGMCLPHFEIKDISTTRIASWMAGDAEQYLKDMEKFGFNHDEFVTIPKIYLKYIHDNERGWLILKSLDNNRRKEKQKSLTEKLLELIPQFPKLTPQPA